MHILNLLNLAVFASLAAASPTAGAEALSSPEQAVGVPLEKRACTYTGCTCLKGIKAGVYCGNCYNPKDHNYWAVQTKGSSSRFATHAFQCASSGDCCDYGVASDCGKTSARCYYNGTPCSPTVKIDDPLISSARPFDASTSQLTHANFPRISLAAGRSLSRRGPKKAIILVPAWAKARAVALPILRKKRQSAKRWLPQKNYLRIYKPSTSSCDEHDTIFM
ncbi:hypothetical protein PSPO01_11506 [Paraphaeosphaeria sporulosa]